MANKRCFFPDAVAIEVGITLSKTLNRSIFLMRQQIKRWPDSEQRWAFEIGLRKAFARRRYYKRLFGQNRVLWGR